MPTADIRGPAMTTGGTGEAPVINFKSILHDLAYHLSAQ